MAGKIEQEKPRKLKEQILLFTEESLLPVALPGIDDLQPAYNLSAIFDNCHNYIYANEGVLKDKIFHEMVKLLVVKLHDERNANNGQPIRFGITSAEYKSVLANTPSAFEERLNSLFQTVRKEYGALFDDYMLKLKPLTLAYVVGQLQDVSLLKTPGDVKGEAFQTFVYSHQRGDRGEFFTPYPIVKLAVELIAPKPNERIIDPACGSGGFLIRALAYIQQNFQDIDKVKHISDNVRGVEFNPDIALAATIRIAFEGGIGKEILCANTLSDTENLDGTFDVILTNPPFGNKGKVEDTRTLKNYVLARKWQKLSEEKWQPTRVVLPGQSPDILFIEKCVKLLKPGGRMAMVLPDGLFQNISSSHIRYWLRQQAKILGVVSIPQDAFIPYGTGITTSLLLLQKHPVAVSPHPFCFMSKMEKVGYDVKGQPIYKRDSTGRYMATSKGEFIIDDDVDEIVKDYRQFSNGDFSLKTTKSFGISEEWLNSRLDVEHYLPLDLELIQELKSKGAKPLGEIAEILTESDNFKSETPEGEIRYIAISDVDARTMQVVSQQYLKVHEAPSRASYRLKAGDIITATAGASSGTRKQATALITDDESDAICSNGFAVIRNVIGVEPLFLLAYMRTDYFLRQVKRLMTGHAIPAISLEDLSKILIPIPPMDEQIKIAEKINSLLSIRKEAIKMSEGVIKDTERIAQV